MVPERYWDPLCVGIMTKDDEGTIESCDTLLQQQELRSRIDRLDGKNYCVGQSGETFRFTA